MAASATEEQVPLRILVDEEKNRVVFVQAGKDFVDVLLSFLTLPLGTIARLVGKDSNMHKVSVGSLSSLYESVANLEEKQFWTEACKEMLLQPKNSMEAYCRNLKLNIDDTEKTKFFICENWDCSRMCCGNHLLSTFRNKRCKCGKLMNREISPKNEKIHEGFVPEMATFIISDDLKVMPDNFQTSLPMDLGCEDFKAIKEVTVNVCREEIVDLLKCSLLSKTPLTDLFLRKKQFPGNARPTMVSDSEIGKLEANVRGNSRKMMKVKVMLRKSNSKILFALADENFVDFLLSFLTFPLGGVEHMLNGKSCLGSIDNLYMSMLDWDGSIYLRSNDLKDKLVKSQLAHLHKISNQILPIDEMPPCKYTCYSELDSTTGRINGYLTHEDYFRCIKEKAYVPLDYLEPQSSTGKKYSSCGGRGFAERSSMYMVTDDLVVTPGSSISAVSFLTKLKIPRNDLEERVISIGKEEGLSILKASLISSSALTNGLSQFIKPVKQENIPIN